MRNSLRYIVIVVFITTVILTCCSYTDNYSSTPAGNIPFDTSYSAPFWWKTIDDPKWGFRLNVPRSLQDKDFEGRNLWVHEDANMRVIVDFGRRLSQEKLGLKKNYSETILRVNGLQALVCTYEEESNSVKRGMNKVAALIFLDYRDVVGSDEPSFRVEYAAKEDLKTALQILQTVRFYEP